ncbi:hypothetical protein DIGNKC_214 [Bacillus phage DIGNKC]|uniref:virion structural protein n=1 Tax=Bacillus phage DIGNKC TaxID=1805948 RepID=UPI0007A76D1B|nr:virion structural protein [Bacillus phage DIGNKC]AMW62818.1 hypothetical protein DIGNKC_214 [Bacillus phage DIGNKC]AOZ61840.1 hypothetical protein BJ4_217 [Bacillus phage BJ4]
MAVDYNDIGFDTAWGIMNFELLTTLEDKLDALVSGDTLVIRNFEQFTKADVLIKMKNIKGKDVTVISYDTMKSSLGDAFWQVYNIGINDLSLLPVLVIYDIKELQDTNKFGVGDVVAYVSAESGKRDTAFITDIYRSIDPNKKGQYLYALSREDKYAYEQNELMEVK